MQSKEGRQLMWRTTDSSRRVRRAGNSLGGPISKEGRQLVGKDHRLQLQSEKGEQLIGRTTDTRRRVRRAGNS